MKRELVHDVPRLLDAASTDPLLRDALRSIKADAPDVASLGALADAVEKSVAASSAAQAAAMSGTSKVVLAVVIACAGAYGAYRLSARAPEVARPTEAGPADALEAAPRLVEQLEASGAESSGVGDTTGDAARAATPSPSAEESAAPVVEGGAEMEGTRRAGKLRRAANGRAAAASSPDEREAEERDEAVTSARQSNAVASSEDEVTLLERAQRALLSNPSAALERLEEHRTRWPRGAFEQEREALYIDALQRVGRSTEMRRQARAFLQRWPGSPHRSRIERLLGSE